MFTGIVEAVGTVARISRGLLVSSVPAEWTISSGESVAVDGVCLTAVRSVKGSAVFELSRETFARTAIGSLRKGSPVNLERAIRADGRFSGHFVTGHVDGTTRLLAISRFPGGFELSFEAPQGAILVEKGSVALNGVSLTVFGVSSSSFRAAIIPHTWKHTGLNRLKIGERLNIEYDILGKYAMKRSGAGLTRAFLSENGFMS